MTKPQPNQATIEYLPFKVQKTFPFSTAFAAKYTPVRGPVRTGDMNGKRLASVTAHRTWWLGWESMGAHLPFPSWLSKLGFRHGNPFPLQKVPLTLYPAGVPAQGTVGRDHPVSGDENGKRVPPVGLAHGLEGPGRPHAIRQLPVGDGSSIGDVLQHLPHPALKLGAVRGHG